MKRENTRFYENYKLLTDECEVSNLPCTTFFLARNVKGGDQRILYSPGITLKGASRGQIKIPREIFKQHRKETKVGNSSVKFAITLTIENRKQLILVTKTSGFPLTNRGEYIHKL